MKYIYNCLPIIILLLMSVGAVSQETQSAHNKDHFQHHRLALFTGYGLIQGAINEEGKSRPKVIPVIGLDYEYSFNHNYGLGLLNDLELSTYSVEDNHQDYIERNYAFVTALVFLYEPIIGWSLFAGPGYEFERNHGFALFKLGSELSKNFNEGWSLGVAVSYDFKELNSSLSFGLTAGKRLGK